MTHSSGYGLGCLDSVWLAGYGPGSLLNRPRGDRGRTCKGPKGDSHRTIIDSSLRQISVADSEECGTVAQQAAVADRAQTHGRGKVSAKPKRTTETFDGSCVQCGASALINAAGVAAPAASVYATLGLRHPLAHRLAAAARTAGAGGAHPARARALAQALCLCSHATATASS